MVIAPNGILRILKGVPLDPSLDHTIYFPYALYDPNVDTSKPTSQDIVNAKVAQQAYFKKFIKETTVWNAENYSFELTNISYQRYTEGNIKVEIPADLLYDCNYIMFQNLAFGTKWFYAYIRNVSYVSNTVSIINYEIDSIQTWLFDFNLEQCFVEREMSYQDEMFENLVPENIERGEYVSIKEDKIDFNEMKLAIVSSRQAGTTEGHSGKSINGVYSGLEEYTGFNVREVPFYINIRHDIVNNLPIYWSITDTYYDSSIPDSHTYDGTTVTQESKYIAIDYISTTTPTPGIAIEFNEKVEDKIKYIRYTISSDMDLNCSFNYESNKTGWTYLGKMNKGTRYTLATDWLKMNDVTSIVATLRIYSPVSLKDSSLLIDKSSALTVTEWLNNVFTSPADVLSIYQYPAFLDKGTQNSPAKSNITFSMAVSEGKECLAENYIPKNKKLLTYPYTKLFISDNTGNNNEYRFENYDGARGWIKFSYAGTAWSKPIIMLYPNNYRGIEDDYESALCMSNFPVCGWSTDAFKEYWSNHKGQLVSGFISDAINGTIGAIAGFKTNTMTGVTSLAGSLTGVANKITRLTDMPFTPPTVHGQVQCENLNVGMGRVQFSLYQLSIKKQFAEIIDDYFSRYGYATHRNKIPNTHSRPRWNYVKTVGCTITGSIPADDANKITALFEKGITFWKSTVDADEIGDYGQSNQPTT